MRRFAVYTRGRTGSSPIVEELNNHPQTTCHGEVMRPDPLARVNVRKAYEQFGKEYISKARTRDQILPYKLFVDEPANWPVSDEGFASYLAYLDDHARSAGDRAVGWKMIAREWPDFFELCAKNNVLIIYLRRRNLVRQAVSALIALETKIYNLQNFEPEPGRRFFVAPEKISARIRTANRMYAEHEQEFSRLGIDVKIFYYEDWLIDRKSFFSDICPILEVDTITPASTKLSRITPEPLAEIIENYDEFVSGIKRAGFGEYLEQC